MRSVRITARRHAQRNVGPGGPGARRCGMGSGRLRAAGAHPGRTHRMIQMESPRVTVIVPCRNEARYISACLDSILATAYPLDRLEVLVVDGQSTDGTRDII